MDRRKRIEWMTNRELRNYRKAIILRREQRRKKFVLLCMAAFTFCFILAGAIFYGSFRTEASDGFKYYQDVLVEPGDTVWTIANAYLDKEHYKNKAAYVAEVRRMNHLNERCDIVAGQILLVPYYSAEFVY